MHEKISINQSPEKKVFGLIGSNASTDTGKFYIKKSDDSRIIGWEQIVPLPTSTLTVTPTQTKTPYPTRTPRITATPTTTPTQTPTFPSVTWTYSDTDGDPQSAYEIKVFDSTTYGAGTFSPDTSTPTVQTGIVTSTNDGQTLEADLADGTTYRAYVRVAQLLNGSNYFSDWAPVLRPATGIQELATGRYFKFRIYATITDTSATLLITKASVWVKLNDCLDSGFQSSNTPIVFNAKFYQPPVMTISGFNTIPSDYYQITNLTASGATVTWYDASNNVVTKDYGWTAQGYGSR